MSLKTTREFIEAYGSKPRKLGTLVASEDAREAFRKKFPDVARWYKKIQDDLERSA